MSDGRRRMTRRAAMALATWVLATVFMVAEGRAQSGVSAKWPARFSADFTTDFGKRFPVSGEWVALGGTWEMENGMLQGKGPGAVLMCKTAFRLPLRVEYDCRSDDPCDLSLALRGALDPKGVTGYYVGFGSYNNTHSKIDASPGGQLARNSDGSALIQPGKVHHVVVELTQSMIVCAVDGRQILSARAKAGLTVRHVGLCVWNSGSFDNLKVLSPHEPSLEPSLMETKVRRLVTFSDASADTLPELATPTAAPDCRVRVVDRPTWVYDIDATGPDSPCYGLFYMAIDTDSHLGRSMLSIDHGKTFSSESLRPGQPSKKEYEGELLVRLEVASASAQGAAERWRTIGHDDGTHESHWATSAAPSQVQRKRLPLDVAPSMIEAARVTYRMAGPPFHMATKKQYTRPDPLVKWVDILVWVNDEIVARGSPMELATMGWHKVDIDPSVLRQGENTVDFTWAEQGGGEQFVADACVELTDDNAGPGQTAGVSFDLPALSAGLVQFDVMAERYEGEALRVSLGAGVHLVVDARGAFLYEAGGKSRRLLDSVRFPNVPGDGGPFGLRPNRWLTLRLDFDCPNAVANVAIIDLYTTVRSPQSRVVAEYLVLGDELPMPLASIQSLQLRTGGTGRLVIDNLFVLSRTADLSETAAWRVPARRILLTPYALRKDPFQVRTYSLRHLFQPNAGSRARPGPESLRIRRGEHPSLLDCAMRYNRLLVAQAFLGERYQELQRSHYLLSQFPGDHGKPFDERLAALGDEVTQTEEHLDGLYRLYGTSYMDGLNEEKLGQIFPRRAERLHGAIDQAEDGVRLLAADMKRDAARVGEVLDVPAEQLRLDRGPTEFARGAFRRNGRPCLLAAQRGHLPYRGQDEILGLGTCEATFPVHRHPVWDAYEPALVRDDRLRPWAERGGQQWLAPGQTVGSSFGYWMGLHRCHSMAPKWWLDKHGSDPDLYLQGPDGEHATGSDPLSLNFWHPEVRRLHTDLCRDVTAQFLKYIRGEVWFGNLGAEAFLCGEAGGTRFETGYNAAAVSAFRNYLKQSYKRVEELNAAWRTGYAGFDAIEPPPSQKRVPRATPGGLTYEWARFRQQSWHGWIRSCRDAVREVVPGLPFSSWLSIGGFFGVDYISGFDPVEIFETFDIVADHGRMYMSNMVPNSREMDSLRQACGGCTGNLEWGAYPFVDIFDEQDTRLGALRLAYRMLTWGDTVLEYWYGTHAGWADSCNWADPRFGHTVLRYSAAFIPLSIARAHANADVFFACPTIQPEVVILESQTSFYNAWPPYILRSAMGRMAELLEQKGHNYGFLFETLLLDGRQTLDAAKVVLLPHAVTLPKAMTVKLMDWVRRGGVLIAAGPPGLFGPCGEPAGELLEAVFGDCAWTRGPKGGSWQAPFAKPPTYVVPDDGRWFLAQGRLGRGTVYIANGFPTALAEPVYQLVRTHAPRRFYARANGVELIMRQGQGCRYLSVFNATAVEVEDEIVLRQAQATLHDKNTGMPIAAARSEDGLAFKVCLAPVEGMVVRIDEAD